ncbi:MAG TPA: ABC transporter substrate-binding protein [Thermomicrobiales bacterium]|nr:ABC transporter substrate-binding protein [Thermomicrobiales bacterium]
MSDQNRKQVSELLDGFRKGSISRRELFVKGSALGVGAYFLNRLSVDQAFAQDATPEAVAAGSTLVAPAGFDQSMAGQKINVILGDEGSGAPWEKAACALFQTTTGIETTRVPGETSTTDKLAKLLLAFNAQSSDVDCVSIDVIWPGIVAPHALDLTDTFKDTISEYFQAIVENNTVDSVLVGIPWYTDAGLLYKRDDLLEKYSQTAPATWADLETAAKAIQDGERAAGSTSFVGFVWQGNAYEGLTCNALEWQVSNGGGNIIESDGTVSVNNPQAIAAFQRAAGWVKGISPEGVTTYQEQESLDVWQGGNAAFMRNWPYAYANGQSEGSVIKDKFSVGVIPKGDGENARNASTLGGWQLMASKYSKAPDAAKAFCKFMASAEVQKSASLELSHLPTIASIYDDADVLAKNPFYADLKPVFQGGAVPRPSTVSSSSYNDVSTAYFTAVHNILTGSDATAEVTKLEGQLKDIMAELNS